MTQGFDYDRFAYFVLLQKNARTGSTGFTGYTDVDGNTHYIWDGRTDHNGNEIPRKFRFSSKERTMRIPMKQQDKNGNSVVEFLENSPWCKGSPNLRGGDPLYARLNEEADAEVAIDAKRIRVKAENYVLGLETDELLAVAVLFGVFTDKPKLALHALLEHAGNEPEGFLEIVEDPAIEAKILLKRCLNADILSKQGGMIRWEKEVIGADESSAVQRLLKDEDLVSSLKTNLSKS